MSNPARMIRGRSRRALDRGMSQQRPLYRAWKQDAARVDRWQRGEFPAIRARADAADAVIFFADEASACTGYDARHHVGSGRPHAGGDRPAGRYAVKMVSAAGRLRRVQLRGSRGREA